MRVNKWLSFVLFGLMTFTAVARSPFLVSAQNLQFPYEADLITYQEDTGQAVFNWEEFTLGKTPPFSEAGHNGTSAWGVGTPVADALKAGNLSGWGAQELSIDDIERIVGGDLKHLALTAYPHVTSATVDELVGTLGLSNFAPKEVQPLLKLAEKVGGAYAKQYLNKTIGELLGDHPEFGQYSLNSLQAEVLENFDLESIPGADLAQLGQFAGWSDVRISDIPGLADVSFASLPEFTGPAVTPVARVGVIHDKNESNSTVHVISGGGEAGYNIPCEQENCSYIELDPVAGDRAGQRWNVGGNDESEGQQSVKGGFGADVALRAINGGKEPVGRPLGDDMQLVITSVDQAAGSIDLAIYIRACETNPFTGKTCSPRALGPLPIGTFTETSKIPVGLGKYAPPSIQPSVDTPRPRAEEPTDQSRAESAAQEVDEEGNTVIPAEPTPCTEELNKLSHPDKQAAGQVAIPAILRYAKGYNLNQPQTAFVLAYFESRGYTDNIKGGIQKLWPSLKQSITNTSSDYFGIAAGLGVPDPGATANKASQFNSYLAGCNGGDGNCILSSRIIRPAKGGETSDYGSRWHPLQQRNKFHTGVDIGAPLGTPVVAPDCGVVEFADWNGGPTTGYGRMVVIQHGSRYKSRLAHLQDWSVKKGDTVEQGQIVGLMGTSGYSTGPHLHWEVWKDGNHVDPNRVESFR